MKKITKIALICLMLPCVLLLSACSMSDKDFSKYLKISAQSYSNNFYGETFHKDISVTATNTYKYDWRENVEVCTKIDNMNYINNVAYSFTKTTVTTEQIIADAYTIDNFYCSDVQVIKKEVVTTTGLRATEYPNFEEFKTIELKETKITFTMQDDEYYAYIKKSTEVTDETKPYQSADSESEKIVPEKEIIEFSEKYYVLSLSYADFNDEIKRINFELNQNIIMPIFYDYSAFSEFDFEQYKNLTSFGVKANYGKTEVAENFYTTRTVATFKNAFKVYHPTDAYLKIITEKDIDFIDGDLNEPGGAMFSFEQNILNDYLIKIKYSKIKFEIDEAEYAPISELPTVSIVGFEF